LVADSVGQFEIINLGNSRSENLMDLIGVLSKELSIEPQMDLLPMQSGDVETTFADINEAQTKLNFTPTTPITEGIPKFISWYRQYHNLK
jgi:UDP-glucuronate 4-epimerase